MSSNKQVYARFPGDTDKQRTLRPARVSWNTIPSVQCSTASDGKGKWWYLLVECSWSVVMIRLKD